MSILTTFPQGEPDRRRMIAGLTRQLSRKGFDGLALWGSISYHLIPCPASNNLTPLTSPPPCPVAISQPRKPLSGPLTYPQTFATADRRLVMIPGCRTVRGRRKKHLQTKDDMTQEEHLNKIVAKCRELLAIADNRSKGQWIKELMDVWLYEGDEFGSMCVADCNSHHARTSAQSRYNAAFIANCAGPAEAGWRATIAAIESLRSIQNVAWNGREMHPCGMDAAQDMKKIIAAWPEELL